MNRSVKSSGIMTFLFQLLYSSKAILVASNVKTSNFNLFGSAFQNQFSSSKAIMVEAIIPNF